MAEKIVGDTLDALLTVLVAIAAGNWALTDTFDTNLLTDVAGLSGDTLTFAYLGFGVAAVVVVYNTAVWRGWIE